MSWRWLKFFRLLEMGILLLEPFDVVCAQVKWSQAICETFCNVPANYMYCWPVLGGNYLRWNRQSFLLFACFIGPFRNIASALDSASGSVLLSEALSACAKHARIVKTIAWAEAKPEPKLKLAWVEAKAVVLKRSKDSSLQVNPVV